MDREKKSRSNLLIANLIFLLILPIILFSVQFYYLGSFYDLWSYSSLFLFSIFGLSLIIIVLTAKLIKMHQIPNKWIKTACIANIIYSSASLLFIVYFIYPVLFVNKEQIGWSVYPGMALYYGMSGLIGIWTYFAILSGLCFWIGYNKIIKSKFSTWGIYAIIFFLLFSYTYSYYPQTLTSGAFYEEDGNMVVSISDSDCPKLFLYPTYRNYCYNYLANLTKDAGYCDKINFDKTKKDECYLNIAELTQDTSICNEHSSPNNCLAYLFRDLTYCNNLDVQEGIYSCYDGVARFAQDASLCDVITNETRRNLCRYHVRYN